MIRYARWFGCVGLIFGLGILNAHCDTKGNPENSTQDGGETKDTVPTDNSSSDQGTALKWYKTCGDLACGGHRVDPNVSECTTQKEGDACTTRDEKCDPKNDCNAHLLCTDKDPTQGPGGCPISQRSAKEQIKYLSPTQKASLHRSLMQLRLATYRYTSQNRKGAKQFGFIIEDHPPKALLHGKGNRVDLYSYISLLTASLQVQARQIKALQAQVAKLQRERDAQAKSRQTQSSQSSRTSTVHTR